MVISRRLKCTTPDGAPDRRPPTHRDHGAGSAATIFSFTRNAQAASHPRDRLEELVVELWQEFLGAPPSNVRENFFDAGGDSLIAVA